VQLRPAAKKKGDEMKTFTIKDILNAEPCYDPCRYLSEDWSGTALDLLSVEDCPPEDRIWAALHLGALSESGLTRFSCRCVRETPLCDGRVSWDLLTPSAILQIGDCVKSSESYAAGEIGREEMDRIQAYAMAIAWAATAAASTTKMPEARSTSSLVSAMGNSAAAFASAQAENEIEAKKDAIAAKAAARVAHLRILREEIEKGAEDGNAS